MSGLKPGDKLRNKYPSYPTGIYVYVEKCDCSERCTYVRVKCPDGCVRSYPRKSFKLAGEKQLLFPWGEE